MNDALAWWALKWIATPLCVGVVLLTIVDAVIDLFRKE